MAFQHSLFDLFTAPPAVAAEPRDAPRVRTARGALAAERSLLEELAALSAEARRDPRLLAKPVRIVVPSRSLRLHLTRRLVTGRGRSLAGVTVQTLHALALEILERSGEPAPRGGPLLDVLVQRFARKEPVLSDAFDGLVDGYAAVVGSVRDLLDAGFRVSQLDPALEALAASPFGRASRAARERAAALLRVAARVEAAAEQLAIGFPSHLLRRAAALLRDEPAVLPVRALRIHGFADATGVASELLEALLRLPGALLLLDRPPAPEAEDGGEAAFTQRLEQRLSLRSQPRSGERPALPRLGRWQAPGAEAEVRAVAAELRTRLEEGVVPEEIAIVARDLEPYRFALRRHLTRLGIPFSGLGARGGITPAGRRFQALLDLLRNGEACSCDRWLDADLGRSGRSGMDLRLAFRALGAGRLRDLAGLELAPLLGREGRYPLPVRLGLRAASPRPGEERESDEESEGPEIRSVRRSVAGEEIARALAAAERLRLHLNAWPASASAAEHFAHLGTLLRDHLGWSRDEASGEAFTALDELIRELPAAFPLTFSDVRLMVERALSEAGGAPFGGSGGGVQVLTVMEARARTWEHLFLLGLNRDVFPRPVREDPLFPDALRLSLTGAHGDGVLADLPIKRNGFEEERHLFAQLLSSAPGVTLSWQAADDDGRTVSPSPLLDRLPAGEVRKAPPLHARALPGLRPADEEAVAAALFAGGGREEWAVRLAVALEECHAPEAARRLSAVRRSVLDELDPDLRTPEGRAVRRRLGPWFGFVGPLAAAGDPRRRELPVTWLEGLAACPWQTFLGRLLGIEPTPDPLQALPGLDPLLLGNAVHAVLERAAGAPRSAAELETIVREECERAVREEGIALSGLARALGRRVDPFLETARRLADLGAAGAEAEVRGAWTAADSTGRPWTLTFRADRVDSLPEGKVFTDYKTGRPVSDKKQEASRRRDFLHRVRTGSHLQAVAYALGGEGRGRYLYLRPDVADDCRELAVTGEDAAFRAAFEQVVAAVLELWIAGTFFPRLVSAKDGEEPVRCSFCAVADACLRRDSGSRLRLLEWAAARPADPGAHDAASALLSVWALANPQEEA